MGEGVQATLLRLIAAVVSVHLVAGCSSTRKLPSPPPETFRVETESPRTFAAQEFEDLEPEDRPYEGTVIEDAQGNLVKFYYIRPGRGAALAEIIARFTGIDAARIEHKPDWGEKQGTAGYEMIIVTGTENEFQEVDDTLDQFEAQVPMVEIEAQVVELLNDEDFQLGVQTIISDISRDGGDNEKTLFRLFRGIFDTNDYQQAGLFDTDFQGAILELGSLQDQLGFDFLIQALQTKRLANILSAPKISVLDGFKATITVGDEVPVQTFKSIAGTALVDVTFKQAAIRLEVTPFIVGKDSIRLDIKPEVSRITGFTDPGPRGLSNPILSTRNAETSVIIRSGYTFAIGGLIGNTEIEDELKTPLLGDIPLIKYLFRTTRKQKVDTNLIFLIKPRIRYPVYYGKPSERIFDPGLDTD